MGDQRPKHLWLELPFRPAARFAGCSQHPGRLPVRTEPVRVRGGDGQLANRHGRLRGLWQLDDTRVDGRAVAKSRQQVIGVGPGLLWSNGHATVIANLFEEVEARNRPRGISAVLSVLYPF
jgi:hypothetical protein